MHPILFHRDRVHDRGELLNACETDKDRKHAYVAAMMALRQMKREDIENGTRGRNNDPLKHF